MPTLSELELLAAFRHFCTQSGGPFADFEEVEPSFSWFFESLTASTSSSEKVTAFEPIGHDGTDSYAAFWREPDNHQFLRPIVWLDSEGQVGVIADSFADFLSLIPYGIGLIKTVVHHFEMDKIDANTDQQEVKRLTNKIVPQPIAEVTEEYPALPRYIEWLTRTTGLTVTEHPVAQMTQAYLNHSNLKQWLSS